jgi:hypothetical protein
MGLLFNLLGDAGMQNPLKFDAPPWLSEHELSHSGAIKGTVRIDQSRPKSGPDGLNRSPSWSRQLVRD